MDALRITLVLMLPGALLAGCPRDLDRRQFGEQGASPTEAGVDLPRDIFAGKDLRDHAVPPDTLPAPDLGCINCVATLAGNGQAGGSAGKVPLASARFAHPHDLVVDSGDTLYVADRANHVIRWIDSGVVDVLAGSMGKSGFADGQSASAFFNNPSGLAIDSKGVIYVADTKNNAIRMINKGKVDTIAGNGDGGYVDGDAASARFLAPLDVAVSPAGDKIYVADSGNHMIRIIENGKVQTLAGNTPYCGHKDGPAKSAQLCSPQSVLLVGDKLYVANSHGYMRLVWKGQVSTLAGNGKTGFYDGVGQHAQMAHPLGMALDTTGQVLLCDRDNHALRTMTPQGHVTTLAGTGWGGFKNGPGKTSQFRLPSGVAVDSKGTIYVADSANHAIRTLQK